MIMELLSFREKLRLLKVSRQWREYFKSRSIFWREVDLLFQPGSKSVKKSISNRDIKFILLDLARGDLRSIVFGDRMLREHAIYIAGNCKLLKSITLMPQTLVQHSVLLDTFRRTNNLRSLTVSTLILKDGICSLDDVALHLTDLHLYHSPTSGVNLSGFFVEGKEMPNLKTFTFEVLDGCLDLRIMGNDVMIVSSTSNYCWHEFLLGVIP